MRIEDVFPKKAQFAIDEPVFMEVLVSDESTAENRYLCVEVYNLNKKICEIHKIISDERNIEIEIPLKKTTEDIKGYGTIVKLYENDILKDTYACAFDKAKSWKYAPRYGFISDFSKEDSDNCEDIKEMNKLHLNIVQFYDWMYRHHELFPENEDFVDPLSRKLSMKTVKNKIDFCHRYSMKSIAYTAIYGAEEEFFLNHKDMALYKADGVPMKFIDFIYFMDINRENPWHDHIINEFIKALNFGFDGLHLDQYGFPKRAFSSSMQVRSLEDDFPVFINDVKDSIKQNGLDSGVIFNAVNNWPVSKAAKSKEDAVYIEVWSPNETYEDLYNLISRAKAYAPNKQVILAAYMKTFKEGQSIDVSHAENSALMTMAVIFASGGFHLLLGEKRGLLTEGYYPSYEVVTESFQRKLRDYYDFIVRYEELLFDLKLEDVTMTYTGGINGEFKFKGGKFSPKAQENCVWTLIKQDKNYRIINLVNFTGIRNMNWNDSQKEPPKELKDIEVTALIVNKVKGVYFASPDFESGNSISLKYEYVNEDGVYYIRFTIPKLNLWDVIYIETETK